jgi:hypothetical protein
MAITFRQIAVNPSDSASLAGPLVSVTPSITLTSCVAGDLVVMVVGYKNGAVTPAISNPCNQTWTSETVHNATTAGLTLRLFHCVFNGTWGGSSLSVSIGAGTLAMSIDVIAFAPTTAGNTWSVIHTQKVLDQAASLTTTPAFQANCANVMAAGDLGFGVVLTNDDNTFTNAHDWTTIGTAQYRNLQGNDISLGFQYIVPGTGGVSQYPGWTQSGSDTYAGITIGFRETAAGLTASTTETASADSTQSTQVNFNSARVEPAAADTTQSASNSTNSDRVEPANALDTQSASHVTAASID